LRAQALIAEAEKNSKTAGIDQRVAQVKSIFEPSEAEVLRDESKIIIRLKSVQFPSGSAELGKKNIELMEKIKQAVEICKDDNITVEGHTDSVGTEKLNNRLSQERAELVKSYLVSQGVVAKDRIAAVGFGSTKPLMSNKTKEGRATNRRIDIIANPNGPEASRFETQSTTPAE
jgi:outer membrane protein OmpA-like peptidoglycan-associated protein